MKHLIIYSGIALVVFVNIANTSYNNKSGVRVSQVVREEVAVNKGFKTAPSEEFISDHKNKSAMKASTKLKSKTPFLMNITKLKGIDFTKSEEPIESVAVNRIIKTADELIAEDNLITGNNISNETQALDFDVINGNSMVFEVIESTNLHKIGKTADELIAEDNLITENNISNETQPLDFERINRNLNN